MKNILNEIDVRINSIEVKISDFEDNVSCPKWNTERKESEKS